MKTDARNSMVFRLALVFLLLLVPGRVWTQDLELRWGNYLAVETRVELARAAEGRWIDQHDRLGVEVRELQASRSWDNGWIIELRIARKSSLQVELADSLRQVQDRIAGLKAQRADTFSALKKVYRQILLEGEPQERFTLSEKEQAITIGRRLMNRGNDLSNLPDYTAIIDSPYEHKALKRLVLTDLQSVVQAKLVLIDSLLAEKETEVALLNRLNDFHRDLGFQLKSNIDLATAGSQEAAGFNAPSKDAVVSGGTLSGANRSFDRTNESQPDQPLAGDQFPILPGDSDAQLGIDPVDDIIKRLEDKRRQYQLLLQRLQAELRY